LKTKRRSLLFIASVLALSLDMHLSVLETSVLGGDLLVLQTERRSSFGGVSTAVLAFGRVALEDLGPVVVTLHQDSEAFDILEFVTTGLRVLELASDVRVSVSKEEVFAAILV